MKQSKQYWQLSSTANCRKHIRIDYEQSPFFLTPSSETHETKMTTRVTAALFSRAKRETARILHVYGNTASLRLFFSLS